MSPDVLCRCGHPRAAHQRKLCTACRCVRFTSAEDARQQRDLFTPTPPGWIGEPVRHYGRQAIR